MIKFENLKLDMEVVYDKDVKDGMDPLNRFQVPRLKVHGWSDKGDVFTVSQGERKSYRTLHRDHLHCVEELRRERERVTR